MVTWMIIACEIAFWVVIIWGLVMRYVYKKERLGFFFLGLTPIIDLILLIVTGIDLCRGTIATTAHGIAAIYIGVSIAFGKGMIQWADERFQYYIAKTGPKPNQKYGIEYAIHYFKGWLKHVLAYIIGAILLIGIMYIINDMKKTEALFNTLRIWTLVVGIDFVISISYFIWRKEKRSEKMSS
ncbi:MAG: hypothetical protein ACI35O_17615 [Bacillaceae bacterium]